MPTDLHDHAGTKTVTPMAADQNHEEIVTSGLSLFSLAIYIKGNGRQFLIGLAHHVPGDQWMIEIAGVDGVAVARSRAEIEPLASRIYESGELASRIYESGEITPEPRP